MWAIRTSMIILTAVKIRHPLEIITWPSLGLDERPVVLPLHISWYNMSHSNSTCKQNYARQGCQSAASSLKLYAQAKLGSIDSCQNGTCADHNQKTNNVGQEPITPEPSSPILARDTAYLHFGLFFGYVIQTSLPHALETQLDTTNEIFVYFSLGAAR